MSINLKKEQEATKSRPRYKYSLTAKLFFAAMDLITGKQVTLGKAKLIETLASIPYRAWEIRQYACMTRGYRDDTLVQRARSIMDWGREAQDNEYWHLLVINAKMREDGVKDPWYLFPVIPFIMVTTYVVLTRLGAMVNIDSAFHFNAEFEDHAEHVYAQFVDEHPEWENQPVPNAKISGYGHFDTWANVFRRIGLDERDHMNNSFAFCGKPEHIVTYDGMPPVPA